jgi:hypothetical protein
MANDKAAEVTRKLKQVAQQPFLRSMKVADRVDPDRTQSGFLWHEEATQRAGFAWRDMHTEVERESGSQLVFTAPDVMASGEGI